MSAKRPCTCHADDNPPNPCAERYALSECRRAARIAQLERDLAEARAELKTAKIDVGASVGIEALLEKRAAELEAERDRLAAEVERLTASRDGYAKAEQARADEQHRLATEVARLQNGCRIYARTLRGEFATRREVAESLDILASLQTGEKGE